MILEYSICYGPRRIHDRVLNRDMKGWGWSDWAKTDHMTLKELVKHIRQIGKYDGVIELSDDGRGYTKLGETFSIHLTRANVGRDEPYSRIDLYGALEKGEDNPFLRLGKAHVYGDEL